VKAISVVFLAVMLTACSTGGMGKPALSSAGHARGEQTAPTTAPSRTSNAQLSDHHQGSLTAGERSLATAIAKREQAQVSGTFIGATAFVTQGTPFDRGSDCDVSKRFLNVRLVWKAGANFTHSHLPSVPDGPRKDLLMTVDQRTRQACETGAGYRNVGADAGETLLYGEWPSKADG
jgi:hypothetical protein